MIIIEPIVSLEYNLFNYLLNDKRVIVSYKIYNLTYMIKTMKYIKAVIIIQNLNNNFTIKCIRLETIK